MSLSCHSETGVLKKVYLKSIAKGFRNQDEIDRNWQSLNFMARPDFHQALEEYTIFEDTGKRS